MLAAVRRPLLQTPRPQSCLYADSASRSANSVLHREHRRRRSGNGSRRRRRRGWAASSGGATPRAWAPRCRPSRPAPSASSGCSSWSASRCFCTSVTCNAAAWSHRDSNPARKHEHAVVILPAPHRAATAGAVGGRSCTKWGFLLTIADHTPQRWLPVIAIRALSGSLLHAAAWLAACAKCTPCAS